MSSGSLAGRADDAPIDASSSALRAPRSPGQRSRRRPHAHGCGGLALGVANSPAAPAYFGALGSYVLGLSVLHWINDGLMAVFFLLVGLEIKREFLEGQLATWSRRALPGIAALGGMAVPAAVYLAFNLGADGVARGWAIPAATDIAFALGVLSLLGPRVPVSLKIFLTALAIIDDLGAVLIIAVFYSGQLDVYALGGAVFVISMLRGLNAFGYGRLAPYLALGVLLWVLVLKSGIHATLAGVVLAFTVPLRTAPATGQVDGSPLHRLEHGLQRWVTYLVLPLFGLANAGVSLAGMSFAKLLDPVPLGVTFGLVAGKQVGVAGSSWLAIRAGWAELPARATWRQLYGVALLCGIGFTMSLFIGLLAFADAPGLQDDAKIGVLTGSILSAGLGAILLAGSRPLPKG